MPTIIVFCHLRWDFVYQRPQQLLSRLALHYRILFIEEPVHDGGDSFIEQSHPAPNVTVCRPHTPLHASGFHDDQIPLLRPLLGTLLPPGERPIAWFYTPMALPLLQELDPSLVVYDCMDELAAFKNSPKQLLQRESALLNLADLVFAGGPSLYQAKRERHANVHCFPSSVDVRHFERALERGGSHPEQHALARPRLGFYGVIDERFDCALIAELADAHPDWQVVLVGPVLKINPASLPQRPNIHYFGQRTYEELPAFLAGWDVCLLPFALNDATRFISPTKVLEYMAAELPIVSTAITDVAQPYGHIVAIASDEPGFIAACEAALDMGADAHVAMLAQMRATVAATSWDITADAMRLLIAAAPVRCGAPRFAPPKSAGVGADSGGKVNPLRSQSGAQKVHSVIIGAGPTGLSAAYHLGKGALLLEKNASVGGWCRSIDDHGFTFDYAGHIMFSNDPYVLQMYELLLGPNLHWQNREAWVYSKQVYTRYPFQGALYGLPPKVITECIVGAIEARFGSMAGADNTAQCAVKPLDDCCADGTAEVANTASFAPRKREMQNFEEFIYKVWGSGIAKHFAIPYNKKLWTVPLSEMETSWLGGRVPLPDLEDIIEGALESVGKPLGPNARFGYPLTGGFQALMSGFLPHIKGRIEMNASAAQLLPREHVLVMADGSRYRYDHLVSTMPLPELIKLIGAEAPEEVRAAANGLRHISVRCVNLGVGRENLTDKHWIYYPEDTIFHRIFVQGNASPHCNPPGGFGLTCEISYSPWKPLPLDGQALIERCIADCVKVGMLQPDDRMLTANLVDMPYAYVIYDQARAANVATVKDWLARYDIVLAGRYSEWEYYNSDHAFLAGKKAAEAVLRLRADAAQIVSSD
ncbi:NAD(P)-binding protein [Massilia sp. TSP1-1-2]|uniref:NAD(P)-binding protein n=1 Tax=Massilia sp. TSP1-1-2 TaxID=2804649 RepID=UPI003CF09207